MLGQDVNKYIANQFNVRQELYNNTNSRSKNQIQLLNNQNAWIKMASGVSLETDKNSNLSPFAKEKLQNIEVPDGSLEKYKGKELAKKFVLFNGVSSFSSNNSWSGLKNKNGFGTSNFLNSNDSYSKSDFGYVPMPGITGFDIKSLNRGSIKKATIKYKLHSKAQFDIFELLYLRLGYTVLIEFGNNIYADSQDLTSQKIGQTLIEDEKNGFFSEKFSQGGSYIDVLKDIERLRETHGGNYGGFLGKITNFEWSIDNLGSYDVTLNLISLGDIIESLKINLPITKDFSKFLEKATLNSDKEITFKDQISSMLFAYRWLNDNTPKKLNKVNTIQHQNSKKFLWEVGNKMANDEESIIAKSYSYKWTISAPSGVGWGGLSGLFNALASYRTFPQAETFTKVYSQKQMDDGLPSKSYRNLIWHWLVKHLKNTYDEKSSKELANDLVDSDEILITSKLTQNETEIENPCRGFKLSDGFKTSQENPNHYIRLGALLNYVQENTIPTIKDKKSLSQTPIIKIESDTFNYYRAGMYTLPNQLSLDPRVCIVKNTFFNYNTKEITEFYKELEPFRELDLDDKQLENYGVTSLSSEIDGKHSINPHRAYINNIYLNFTFIQDILSNVNDDGDINPFTFLNGICSGINKALGGINRLEPTIDETNNVISIIETTPIPNQIPLTPPLPYTLNLFGFDLKGKGNFIRKLDIKTTISPEYASMITIGSTAAGYVKGTNGTAFSKWNKGLTDRFKEQLDPPGNSSKEDNTTPTEVTSSLFPSEAAEQYFNQYFKQNPWGDTTNFQPIPKIMGYPNILDIKKMAPPYDSNIIDKNLSTATEFYKYAQAKKTLDNMNSNGVTGGIGFIPFKMNFTMNGIEGVKIYNTLRVNSSFLPQAYGKTLDFIITGVDHSIKNNDWETTISTLVQPKSSTPDKSTSIENYDYIFIFLERLLNKVRAFNSTQDSTQTRSKPNTPASTTVKRDPKGAKGTIGTMGIKPKSELAPKALDKAGIDTIVSNSGTTNELRKRIVTILASYVGNNELKSSLQNQGWHDIKMEDKLKKPHVTEKGWGWFQPEPWCAWFVSRVMYEAHVAGNALVSPASDKYKSIWKDKYNDGAKNAPFSAGVSTTLNYFKNKLSRHITSSQAKKDPSLVQPGDIAYWGGGTSHIGIVVKVNTPGGKLTSLDIISGNTGVADVRDGGRTDKATVKISKLKGFSQIFTS